MTARFARGVGPTGGAGARASREFRSRRSESEPKQAMTKTGEPRRLPTCRRRPAARGNFRRRQILFPRPPGGPSASSETRLRSLAGRDTRRLVSLRRGTQPKLPRRVPEVRSVARVGSILFYAPAIDSDGLCSSVMMFSASCGPKISKSFLRRYRGAQGRERPGGVRGWPLRRGAANATRRDCTSHIPAKRVASGCPWACSAPGSVGSSLSHCMRPRGSMKRPPRESWS